MSVRNLMYVAVGNTPLHLAMESAHAEAASLLIEAGADRTRVRLLYTYETASLNSRLQGKS
jgi:ankyrin repeat protein